MILCPSSDACHAWRGLQCAVVAMLLLVPAISLGALGATEASVEVDRVQFEARRSAQPTQFYTVHELTTPNNIVREFVAPNGLVFAVTWQGPLLPDLRTLLGRHFEALRGSNRTRSPAHSKLLLESPDLVIYSEGRLRAFSGRAYLPQLVPAGVALNELR